MKRIWIGLLLLMMLAPMTATAEAAEFYEEMPPLLRAEQTTEKETLAHGNFIRRTYPNTSHAAVDGEMRALVDEMLEAGRAYLPLEKADAPSFLDVGAVIQRTGTSWMSFLTVASVGYERELVYTAHEARVYDMESGARVTLEDVFSPESEAWDALAQAVRAQLTAAFPGIEPDAAALDALCAREALAQADFTLGAARLTLSYHASQVYPGKNTLLHVHLYYPQIRTMMTPRAYAQTDNSRFKMVALTYDDGGAMVNTRSVLDALRRYGAQATFFIIGRTMRNNRDNLMRQQNEGHSLQSHTYTHPYPEDLEEERAHAQREQMRAEMAEIIGVEPAMMRAPGGREKIYVKYAIGYPLINWSLAGGDSGSKNADKVARRVIGNAQDGDIVLLHDLNALCGRYSEQILSALSARGYLFVTMEELMADAGTQLKDNWVYYSAAEHLSDQDVMESKKYY